SRPGFAMTTLSLRMSAASRQPPAASKRPSITGGWRPAAGCYLNHRHFLVLSPHVAQRVAHLANCCIGANGLENRRHQVRRGSRRGAERVERSLHPVAVARFAKRIQFGELLLAG